MTSRFQIARPAKRDLQEITDYCTAEWGFEAAATVVNRIMEVIKMLANYPMAGVAAEQFGASVRKFPAGRYVIYYRQGRTKRIGILHVFHGARDQVRAWKARARQKSH